MKKLTDTMIICEGPDHAGKTKLCQHLIERYRFNYYHCGVQEDIAKYHCEVLDLTYNDIMNYHNNWIIDRLHLSEEVYGNIFRDGAAYDWKKLNQEITDTFSEGNIKYVLIICLPPKQIVVEGHAARNADGNEMFSTVDKVYDSYQKLFEENSNTIQMYKYDFTSDPNYDKLNEYLENL